jgi:deoxyribonuclease-4
MKNFYFGKHLSTKYGLVSSAEFAKRIGINFYQIFLTTLQQYYGKRHSNEELIKLRDKLQRYDIKIVIHASYMLNFCNPINSKIYKSAKQQLILDLNDSVTIGAIGCVVHMGKNCKKLGLTDEQAITNYVTGIKEVLNNTDPNSTIIFETGAGVGTEICTSIYDLRKLYNRFTKEEQSRIKFCIDTCHVFSAGYDIGCIQYVDFFDYYIDSLLGWDNVVCIHFNDSKCSFDCHKDRHADIGTGYINKDGLMEFLNICYKRCIPTVLETPCDKIKGANQIKLIKEWIKQQ